MKKKELLERIEALEMRLALLGAAQLPSSPYPFPYLVGDQYTPLTYPWQPTWMGEGTGTPLRTGDTTITY